MNCLFISDLHLSPQSPDLTALFNDFLRYYCLDSLDVTPTNDAEKPTALYILGDFFDAWIGADDEPEWQQQIWSSLQTVADNGINVYFMHGNRDFLITQKFLDKYNISLLPDPYCLKVYGLNILLSHGDRYCTLDTGHQLVFKVTRNKLFCKIFSILPLKARLALAQAMRSRSKMNLPLLSSNPQRPTANPAQKIPDKYDVTESVICQAMQATNCSICIHGHTHRPAVHEMENELIRHVLSDWHTECGHFLKLSNSGEFTSHYFRGDGTELPKL